MRSTASREGSQVGADYQADTDNQNDEFYDTDEDIFPFEDVDLTERTPAENLDEVEDVDEEEQEDNRIPPFVGREVIQEDVLPRRQLLFGPDFPDLLRDQATQNPSAAATPESPSPGVSSDASLTDHRQNRLANMANARSDLRV